MKTGKIIAGINTQGVHDEPRDTGPELIFQFNQFLLINPILIPVKNPVKMHVALSELSFSIY
jgi:hypothetical protein